MRIARRAFRITALVAAGALLAACGSSGGGKSAGSTTITPGGAYGKVPAAGAFGSAGTVTVAQAPGTSPSWIFPVTPGANSSVYTAFQFQDEMWRTLSRFPNGSAQKEDPAMSLAGDPVWSNGDKTVSMTLKNWKWSDGQPVTAKDAEFWIDMVQAAVKENPSNWGNYSAGTGIPDQIASMTAAGQKLTLNLKAAVNPTWFWEDSLANVIPLPSHAWAKASATGPVLDFTKPANAKKIYDFLAAQSKSVTTYATNPLWKVVDGPYTLTSYTKATGGYAMTPNPAYSGPHAQKVSAFKSVPFTSDTAEWNAVKSGDIDVGYVPFADLPQAKSIQKGYNVFGYPAFGFQYVTYNFKDTTGNFNKIISQLYIRQAFAHLEDEQGYIKAFFYGAGGQGYGPVPVIPSSPYTPANAKTDPYPFSVSAAVSILKAHGWTVNAGGTDVCSKPGSGANECGAGISAGTKLAWNLIYNTSPAIIGEQVTDLVSQAKKAGITITLKSDNFNHMIATYFDSANPSAINQWAMEDFGGFSINTYPTMNEIFNTKGTFNIGEFSDSTADSLIQASTSGSDPSAVTKEASYLTKVQPSLFQPAVDLIEVWKTGISGPPESFESLTQYQLNPEFWYFTK
jgi:peptide/nickel transport system substrate-binding protein